MSTTDGPARPGARTGGRTGGRAGCPLWAKILLVLSLTGNLVVLGLFAGHAFGERERRGGVDRQIAWILRIVPEERRAAAEGRFADVRAALESERSDRRQQLEDIVAAIRAEPFRPEALTAALDRFGEMHADRRNAVRHALVDMLAGFTPAERDLFADRLQESVERWRARRGD